MSQKIALIGMPGSGKTKLGKKLRNLLRWEFIDLDEAITTSEQKSITEIFELQGEEYFRKVERIHLEQILTDSSSKIIACGGGTPAYYDNMDLLNSHSTTIYLSLPIALIHDRLRNDNSRPLLQDKDNLSITIEKLYNHRIPFYKKARHTITHIPDQWRNLSQLISTLNITTI